MLQPHQILTIQPKESQYQTIQNVGYLISVRLKTSPNSSKQQLEEVSMRSDISQVEKLKQEDELTVLIEQNFGIFEKLRGKKRTLVNSVVHKLLKKINLG